MWGWNPKSGKEHNNVNLQKNNIFDYVNDLDEIWLAAMIWRLMIFKEEENNLLMKII